MIFSGLAGHSFMQGCQLKVDNLLLISHHIKHDSPLAGSLGWLLLGAGKPPYGRFSHFWGTEFYRSPTA